MTKLATAAAAVELPPITDVSAFSTTTSAARLALRDIVQSTATMDTSSAAATESVTVSTSLVLPELPSPVVVFELQEFSPAMSLPHRLGLPLRSSIVSDLILPSRGVTSLERLLLLRLSFGTVYRANLGGERAVAVKRLDASETGDACCGS
uniref:Protein kinase domain-containing protein n=1 Tax=Oryza barthii TaxID=65489 RepID=A0A0D3GP73_9ORYZ